MIEIEGHCVFYLLSVGVNKERALCLLEENVLIRKKSRYISVQANNFSHTLASFVTIINGVSGSCSVEFAKAIFFC